MDDRIDAEKVDITVDDTGKLWVNVNDKCILRIGHVKAVIFDDPERGQAVVYQEGETD